MCGPAAPPFTFPPPLPPAQDTLGPDDGSGLYFLPFLVRLLAPPPPQQKVVPPPSNVTLPRAYKCCTSPRSRGRVPRTSLYLTLCGRLAPRRGAQRLRRSCRGLHPRLPLRLLSSLGPLLVPPNAREGQSWGVRCDRTAAAAPPAFNRHRVAASLGGSAAACNIPRRGCRARGGARMLFCVRRRNVVKGVRILAGWGGSFEGKGTAVSACGRCSAIPGAANCSSAYRSSRKRSCRSRAGERWGAAK